ncbi:hypothetical protein LR48_Vigan06g139100 [Vigna angularis]|uniref:Uncharacterized protein n=1 Tax=Phaseolus angularis TaxID=3914 RepID=A0A0L9UT91_PHAAN|nr:hypothetical protein LR48_Vigan06g139100 [Vigna angularis]
MGNQESEVENTWRPLNGRPSSMGSQKRQWRTCCQRVNVRSAVVENTWRPLNGRPSGMGCQKRSECDGNAAARLNVHWKGSGNRSEILNLFPTPSARPSLLHF